MAAFESRQALPSSSLTVDYRLLSYACRASVSLLQLLLLPCLADFSLHSHPHTFVAPDYLLGSGMWVCLGSSLRLRPLI